MGSRGGVELRRVGVGVGVCVCEHVCNGHYNRKPDLGGRESWWNTWDLASLSILDAKVLDRNVTWLIGHKNTFLIRAQGAKTLGSPCSNRH